MKSSNRLVLNLNYDGYYRVSNQMALVSLELGKPIYYNFIHTLRCSIKNKNRSEPRMHKATAKFIKENPKLQYYMKGED